jgi:hypothetical protein
VTGSDLADLVRAACELGLSDQHFDEFETASEDEMV